MAWTTSKGKEGRGQTCRGWVIGHLGQFCCSFRKSGKERFSVGKWESSEYPKLIMPNLEVAFVSWCSGSDRRLLGLLEVQRNTFGILGVCVCVCVFHLLKDVFSFSPVGVLKRIYHWTYSFILLRGQKRQWKPCFWKVAWGLAGKPTGKFRNPCLGFFDI